jgi:DNA modification methylase
MKAARKTLPGALQREITFRRPGSLRVNPRNTRTHSKRQVRQIADSMLAFGNLAPIVVDENGTIVCGHGRRAAASLLGLKLVPTVTVTGLSEAQKRAFAIADNKLTENAGWNRAILSDEFGDLIELLEPIGLDLTITGFSTGEIDQVLHDQGPAKVDPDDALPPLGLTGITRPGEFWQLGHHRILCGDARSEPDLDRLMDGERARMAFIDPPYNVKVAGHVQGRGRIKHGEFHFAGGEMSDKQYVAFLEAGCRNIARVCMDGAIVFQCTDWRHVVEMLTAARSAFTETKNLVVWNKTSPGQGAFYRNQHELIGVFKVGTGEPINSFGLGQHGRMRSNVWSYPGGNSFHAGRMEELAMHPTVKPLGLVADAMRECSMKGEIVLDTYLGSGTTILAAEKTGRRGFGMECDPAYADVAVQRWQSYTRADASLVGDGRTFDEMTAERGEGVRVPGPGVSKAQATPGATQSSAEAQGEQRQARRGRGGHRGRCSK